MPLDRPANAILKQRLASLGFKPDAPAPFISPELIGWLTAAYPQRCYTAVGENLEAHLLYAGKAELVQSLTEIAEAQGDEARALAALADDADPDSTAVIVARNLLGDH